MNVKITKVEMRHLIRAESALFGIRHKNNKNKNKNNNNKNNNNFQTHRTRCSR